MTDEIVPHLAARRMSKKHPSPVEVRWRKHWRRRRLLVWARYEILRNGDPFTIFSNGDGQHSGDITDLQMHVWTEAQLFARYAPVPMPRAWRDMLGPSGSATE